MKTSPTEKAIGWSEILPVTLGSSLIFYIILTWNPIAGAILVFPVVILAFLLATSHLWWCVLGLVPLSVNTELFMQGSLGMYLPTEPLLFGFLLLSIPFFIQHPVKREFMNHRISVLLFLYFGWMAVTVLTSTDNWVSLKSFIAQMWYVVPVFYLGSKILQDKGNRSRFLNVYLIGFSVVAIYTLIRLSVHNFPIKESQWLMQPFFKDHTILGAVLGLVLPYIYLQCFDRVTKPKNRLLWISLGIICTVVLVYTYSRAAILSLVVAGAVYILILLRIRFQYLMYAGILLAGILLWNQEAVVERLSGNRAESSGEVIENIESISNISTDASNLERINRWNSALAMWKERPVFGWGPGTYQFEYAPFQKSNDLTIISTNIGDVGNAHSEFLGTLSESGAPAFILLIALVLVTIGTGYRAALRSGGNDRLIITGVTLGLVAYFTHGILNNFLNSDKVSVLVWGFAAIILHYDLEIRGTQKTN